MSVIQDIRGAGIGWIIALVILIVSIVLMVLGHAVTSFQALLMIALLALAILL